MGASRHGQERALALPEKCTRQLQRFGSQKKEPKSLSRDTFHRLKNVHKLRMRPGLCPRPHWGSLHYSAPPVGSAPDRTGGVYSAPPDILAGFIGYAWQQRRKGRVDREVTREGRRRIKKQGEGWRGKGGRRLQLPLARIPAGAHRGYCKLCNCCHI